MQQRILRVAVALFTFVAGAAAATVFNAVFGPSPAVNRYNYVSPASYHSGGGGCSKKWRSREEFVPPPPAVLVAPDAVTPSDVPPPPKPVVKKRITIKLPDGSVRVVESGGETAVQK